MVTGKSMEFQRQAAIEEETESELERTSTMNQIAEGENRESVFDIYQSQLIAQSELDTELLAEYSSS